MKKMKHVFNRDMFKKTRSPEQFHDDFDTEEVVREIGEEESGFVVFDVMLD